MYVSLKFLDENAALPSGSSGRAFLKARQAQVQDRVRTLGLKPSDFKLRWAFSPDTNSKVLPVLSHVPTFPRFYFIFGGSVYGQRATLASSSESFESWCSPGENHPDETQSHKSWEEQLHYASEWLARIKREDEITHLWTEQADLPAISDVPWEDDAPVTADGRRRIREALKSIEDELGKNPDVTAEDRELVRLEFSDLEAKSETFSKRQWSKYALGVFVYIGQGILRAIGGEFVKWAWPLIAAAVSDAPRIQG